LVEDEATCLQDSSAELGLPWSHLEDLEMGVPVQIVVVEPNPFLGEPDTPDEVTRAQPLAQSWAHKARSGDPNTDTHAHLAGTAREVLMDAEDDWLYGVEEDGAAGEKAAVKEESDPCVELRDPGVSCLATLKENESLTILSSLTPTTSEAARTQRPPAVNTRTPAISETKGGIDLMPPPHDTPAPEAAEPPDKDPAQADPSPRRCKRVAGVALGRANAARDGAR
jgi:hypothetical protein